MTATAHMQQLRTKTLLQHLKLITQRRLSNRYLLSCGRNTAGLNYGNKIAVIFYVHI